MNTEFRIVKNVKEFIISLDDFLINFPKREKVLSDGIKKTGFEILELIFLANVVDSKLYLQEQIVSKLNILDFYFEYAYKKKYISEKQCLNKCDEIKVFTKMIYGWIKNGKS